MMMREELLHHIWKFKLFRFDNLKTISGKSIEILHAGVLNTNAGPDFNEVKIRLENLIWYGAVELHVKSSDWHLHHHSSDPNYHAIILHVVYEYDGEIEILANKNIETLELKPYIDSQILSNYQHFIQPKQELPCKSFVPEIDSTKIFHWKERLLIDRLHQKSERIFTELRNANNDWEALFFHQLSYNFGLMNNAEIFLLWSKSFPFSVLQKIQHHPQKIEALFFGQAGLLEAEPQDEYQKTLKEEYDFIRHKHQLLALSHHLFHYFRMRPVGFPTIRLAQLAAFYARFSQPFLEMIQLRNFDSIQDAFQQIEVNSYWNTHYKFGVESNFSSKNIGHNKIVNILLNTIIPLRYAYMRYHDLDIDDDFFELYFGIKAEKNKITKLFEEANFSHRNAFDSQAYLEAHRVLCLPKKCLNCNIGHESLKIHAR